MIYGNFTYSFCCFCLVTGDVFDTSAFFDGTEPLIKSLFMSTACPDSPAKNTGFCSKQQSSKCAERVLRLEIFSMNTDEPRPLLPQTFVVGKVNH